MPKKVIPGALKNASGHRDNHKATVRLDDI